MSDALRLPNKAKLFRGLADLSRLKILEFLRSGPKCVSELVALTNLSQPNASAHLACLRECGLVVARPDGRRVYYRLADPDIEALLAFADVALDKCESGIAACPNYQGGSIPELPYAKGAIGISLEPVEGSSR